MSVYRAFDWVYANACVDTKRKNSCNELTDRRANAWVHGCVDVRHQMQIDNEGQLTSQILTTCSSSGNVSIASHGNGIHTVIPRQRLAQDQAMTGHTQPLARYEGSKRETVRQSEGKCNTHHCRPLSPPLLGHRSDICHPRWQFATAGVELPADPQGCKQH